MNKMTDNEIIGLMDSNPSEGIRLIIDRYSSLVYTVIYSKLGNVLSSDDIEEFASFVFGRVYEKRGDIDFSRGSLKGYIATVTKRMCIDEYRMHQSRVKTTPITDEMTETMADSRSIQDEAERNMEEKALVSAMQKLSKEDREVLIRRYYFGRTSTQIAKEMKSTDAAIRKRISRAKERLRLLLSESNT